MSQDALQGSMTETLSPREAATVLAQASMFETSLQQRTEGLTGMIWGIAGPGIFLSYAYAEIAPGFPDWGFAILWLPWIAAGGLSTFALWRSAALAMPGMRDPITPMGYVGRFLAVVALISLVFAVGDPDHPGTAIAVIGGMYLVFGVLNPFATSTRGRIAVGSAGAALTAWGIAISFLPETGTLLAATILVGGVVPLAAGLWQTLTG